MWTASSERRSLLAQPPKSEVSKLETVPYSQDEPRNGGKRPGQRVDCLHGFRRSRGGIVWREVAVSSTEESDIAAASADAITNDTALLVVATPPTPPQLAEIARLEPETVRVFGVEPASASGPWEVVDLTVPVPTDGVVNHTSGWRSIPSGGSDPTRYTCARSGP